MQRRIVVMAAGMVACLAVSPFSARAQATLSLTVSNNGTKVVHWPLVPGLDTLQFKAGQRLESLSPVNPATITKSPAGYRYSISNQLSSQFYSLRLGQMSESNVVSANLLNRIAYGPTPDDLERLAVIGPDAYIEEQLAPETIPASIDTYVTTATNGVSLPPNTNWTFLTVTGNLTANATQPLYIYMREVPGQVSVDSVEFYYRWTLTGVTNTGGVLTTNVYTVLTTNQVINGDFEQALGTEWNLDGTSHDNSFRDTTAAATGSASLRVVATAAGTGNGNSIRQTLPTTPPTTARGTNTSGQIWTNTVSQLRGILNFAYFQTPSSHYLTVRLSGDSTVGSGNDAPTAPEWVYATATGAATATPVLYVYLNGAGEAYVDDMKLVAGSVPEAGPNLLVNGDFEQPFSTGWQASTNFDTSYVDNTVSHSGNGSLHIIAETAGAGANSAVTQNVAVANGQIYTVSYWYRPATSGRTLTVRLSGSLLNSTPDTTPPSIKRRLDDNNFSVVLNDLRAWHCANAVGSSRQLLEVLTQFFENHFVTQHSKTSDYFDRYYDGLQDAVATDLEYREVSRWRAALMNPNCTFYDLMKIHIESPAEIIYLDTVDSRGDGQNIANENYARELFELFAMGVDNGYDQQDIVAMSRAWTGWTVDIVDRSQVDNPFAVRSREYGRYPGVGFNAVSNIIGVWTFVFNNALHGTNRTPILSVWDTNAPPSSPRALPGEAGKKRYAARFGPPWAGTSYQLVIPPSRTTPQSGILDGYDVIRHLSTNLHTAEFLSVKLCRLFVHDNFVHGVYDYTDPNRSREADLVYQCILAWDTPGSGTVGGRGNIRRVIRTILNSDLFRDYSTPLRKVKTPLEFVASSVRALRSMNADGSATATTDGYSFTSPLSRMGVMNLFNRAEPDGYPEYAAAWISAGTLAERVRYVQSLLTAANASPTRPGDAGNNFANPVTLLKKKLPNSAWNDASAVTDYFIGIIYPGEGRANLDQYRAAAIQFLNTGDSGLTSSAFSGLGNTSTAYDTRVRGMVSYLMTLQRFQEQ
ncbi:MAG TPA: DUF1800 family protein [Candidatus Binatia bacterium]|nr:DUF1800 family protein [Candidatus Binatia bacterium]